MFFQQSSCEEHDDTDDAEVELSPHAGVHQSLHEPDHDARDSKGLEPLGKEHHAPVRMCAAEDDTILTPILPFRRRVC
jgi:hypothetical protein